MTTQEQLEAIWSLVHSLRRTGTQKETFMTAITALIQEARIEENVRLRRRYNGTNYEKLRATLNYRIEQLSGGSNNEK